MKKIIYTLLLLTTFCLGSKAQSNWDLVHLDKVYTYHYCTPIQEDLLYVPYDFPNDTLPNCHHNVFVKNIDTIGTDTFCYFNLGVDTVWNSSNLNYQWIETAIPFFQQIMVKKANGEVHFQGQDTFVLKPFAALNDNWLYKPNDTITATIVAMDSITLWGVSDSIKIVQLSNGDTISWSRNRGILQYPVNSSLNSSLIGIQSDSTFVGVYIPDFWDIYNFEVGDVLMYEGYNFNIDSPYWNGHCYTNSKVTITGKQMLNDRYIYHYTIVDENDGCNICPLNFNPYYIDSTTFTYDSAHSVNQYSHSMTTPTELVFIDTDTTGNIYKRAYSSGSHQKHNYKSGLGAIYHNYMAIGPHGYCELVGYIKGQDTIGTIMPDSLILATKRLPETKELQLSLFPNPATDFINIYIPKKQYQSKLQLHLFDLYGRLLQNHTLPQSRYPSGDATYMLTTEGLASGLYILQVLDEEGRVLGTEKVVVKK